MTTIRNIYCVGRNYALHAQELNNAVPDAPMFFFKPTHAVAWTNGGAIALPGSQGSVHYEAEWVIHIGRDFEKGVPADQLIDSMALGIDFTLRDVQTVLKKKGYPWLAAKGFLHSAVLTPFIGFPGIDACMEKDFSLEINAHEVQHGTIRQMIFDPQTLIDYCGTHYGLGAGDIIFTGTPAGVGQVADQDRFELKWGAARLGTFTAVLEK